MAKDWRNRIVGNGVVAVDTLMAHPQNARIHPKNQRDALKGAIDDIGFIRSVTVTKDGVVVDGHLRVALALSEGQTTIPVEIVDLDEAETKEALLTLDPIAALAATDKEKLDALLHEVQSGDAAVQQMLADMAAKSGIVPTSGDAWDTAFDGIPDEDKAPFQQMTFTVHDSQVEIINAALKKAKAAGDFIDSENQNSNGNALARICEAYTA